MIKTFLLVAIRNLLKNKTISFIKIAGLAIGLSSVFLIYIYVGFEKSYDSYHKNADRIYRVAYHVSRPDVGTYNIAKTGNNLAPLMQSNFPEIETVARVAWMGEINILQKKQNFKESKFLFADPSILSMFSYPISQGDRFNMLNNRNSIIISSRIAKKYFGDENPIGRYLDDNMHFEVSGVVDVPDNSHFRFDILASYDAIYNVFPASKSQEYETIEQNIYTYIMLKKEGSLQDLEKKFTQFADTHINKGAYSTVGLFLEPLTKIHLESSAEGYYGEFGFNKFTKPLIYLFEFLGLIVIVIACFNFINIAIAQIVGRTQEVGVKKIFGSKKSEIFAQFVCEYGLYSFFAVLISMIIVQFSLPFVCSILNRQIHINYAGYLIVSSIILLLVTIISGAYPSFLIARINAVSALHNGLKGPKGNTLRSVLVIAQFTVSILLVMTSAYIAKQINYLTEMDMGLNTDNVLVVKMDDPEIRKNYELYKSELLRNPDVLSVSASSNIPAVSGAGLVNLQIENKELVAIRYISIDPGFTKSFGVKTIAGESYTENNQTFGKSSFLLNNEAARMLEIDNTVGQGISLSKLADNNHVPILSGQVIGVIGDYAYRPNYEDLKAVVFNCDPDRFIAMFVKVKPDNQKSTLLKIRNTWEKVFPDVPYEANFLSDEIREDPNLKKFYNLQRFITAVAVFSFMIALLGLFGLSMFDAGQRIKEIGIRRVNGASLKELMISMNRKFVRLVLTSVAISFPLVFFIIENIKSNSSKSTELTWTNYTLAFLLIVIITGITVSWQSWRAATRNPVEALRYE